jgi:VanZ family protein
MTKKVTHYLINVLFPLSALMILFLSLLPKIELSSPDIPLLDKVLHCIAYCILGVLGFFFFHFKNVKKIWGAIFSVFLCTLWGVIIELLQSVTGRTPELLDGVVNFIGCQIGVISAVILKKLGSLRANAAKTGNR